MILWYVAAQANVSYMFNTLSIDNTNIFFYIYINFMDYGYHKNTA